MRITHSTSKNMHRGFTLVETLVAVSILAVAISGAFTAAQQGISSSIYSKEQITAFYLAQEAVEQIRNIRDENVLRGNNWLTGIARVQSDPCYYGKTCMVDALDPANQLSTCNGGADSCPFLRQENSSGFFGYNQTWTPTVYKREVRLTQINNDEVSILVTVNWSKGLINRQFRVRENILNWQ